MSEKIKENICANISYYRKIKKLTQKELGDMLGGIAVSTISGWERGASLPDADTIFLICKILGIRISDLYGCDSVATNDSFFLSATERNIIISYRKSDELGKAMVLRSLGIDDIKGEVEGIA